MEWPDFDLEEGTFWSLPTLRLLLERVVTAALGDIVSQPTRETRQKVAELLDLIRTEGALVDAPQWTKIVINVVALQASLPNDLALDMAQAGIDVMHEELAFRLGDDDTTLIPCKDIFMLTQSLAKLETETHVGTKALAGFALEEVPKFPFALIAPQTTTTVTNTTKEAPPLDDEARADTPTVDDNDEEAAVVVPPDDEDDEDDNEKDLIDGQPVLRGLKACAQINHWYQYGLLENSAAVLAKGTLTTTNTSTTYTGNNKVFVVLGCTAELGPAKSLLLLEDCTILGVVRDSSRVAELVDFCTANSPESTTLHLVQGGLDLLTQGPQVIPWVLEHTTVDQEVVICPVARSIHGEEQVRLTVAMDLMVQRLMRQRPKAILWQYLSPLSVMVLPPAVASVAKERYDQRPSYETWAHSMSGGQWLQPNTPVYANNDYVIMNGLVSALGLEHAVAQLIAQWRCMLTYYRDNQTVVAPIAPITKTRRTMALLGQGVVHGMHHFAPLVAMPVGTAQSLLCAVALAQMQFLNRPLPDTEENPFCMFWEGAVSGGVFTCPYTMDSLMSVNWMLGNSWYRNTCMDNPHFMPPAAVLTDFGEDEEQKKEGDKMERAVEILEGSEYGKPMPQSVKDRLEFM